MGLGRSDQLTRFNELPPDMARAEMLSCCPCPAWAERMASGRPYSSSHDAIRQSSAILAVLTVTDLAEALTGHLTGQLAGHLPGSLPGACADQDTDRVLAESNLEYERRFGHAYLVCPAGRSDQQLLALMRSRLGNDARTEWRVVRSELRKINEIRLREMLAGRGDRDAGAIARS
jgi:2-oxo-4-hydroxy-4-carboxy-5-ureidoimidazoline decarboxylase